LKEVPELLQLLRVQSGSARSATFFIGDEPILIKGQFIAKEAGPLSDGKEWREIGGRFIRLEGWTRKSCRQQKGGETVYG
jgi:hypothetical protein